MGAMPTWIETPAGYGLAVVEGKIIARNAKGRELKSVPAAVKKTEEFAGLDQLLDWLTAHEREALAQVDLWMTRGLPVPLTLVLQVWPDPAWSGPLTDLVVDVEGRTGFLRAVNTDDRTVGVVTLDGETEWLTASTLTIPHPVQLGDDLADYQEFAIELGVEQALPQLLREVFTVGDRDPSATAVTEFAGGKFEQLRFAAGRTSSLGFKVQGGYAVCPVWELGGRVEARYWIGAEYYEAETITDELVWVRGTSSEKLGQLGPVAFSEGMRMAARIYAGRTIEEESQ